MNRLSMRALVAMLPALMLASAAGGQENGDAVVTAAVQVTANPNPVRAHATPLLARNPKNCELVIAEVDVRGSRECAVHISTNDGRSWFRGGDVSGGHRAQNESCGLRGRATGCHGFSASCERIGFNPNTHRRRCRGPGVTAPARTAPRQRRTCAAADRYAWWRPLHAECRY